MKRIIILLSISIVAVFTSRAELSLAECLEMAKENYPLIRDFQIIDQTADISLSDINKAWLPGISAFGQTTIQNDVSAYPDALKNVLADMGNEVAGMGKFQYKAGIEVNQTIWDGGHSKAQRAVTKMTAAQSKAALDVQLYAVRERVESLFFGILLLDEQLSKMESTLILLKTNLDKMKSMVRNGVATQSDCDMIEAQILTMKQQMTQANYAAASYRKLLSIFTGKNIDNETLKTPEADMPDIELSHRPELDLFKRQIELNQAREATINASTMPKIGFFAQAYYGYPGFNMFESVMKRNPSFNALAGLKVTWALESFYKKKNARQRLSLDNENIKNQRELFLFNNRLNATRQESEIKSLRNIMADDQRIVELRTRVRMASESQLDNGIIDTYTLLSKITEENQAVLNAKYHEIQYIQEVYKLKNILNQ